MFSDLATQLVASPIRYVYVYAGTKEREGVIYDSAQAAFDLFSRIFEKEDRLETRWNSFRCVEVLIQNSRFIFQEVTNHQFRPDLWDPLTTLVWLPSAQAADLDYYIGHKSADLHLFWKNGGKVVAVCGAAYWQSAVRVYDFVTKETPFALFSGYSFGPLCEMSTVVTWGEESFAADLLGSGYFAFPSGSTAILAHYPDKTAAIIKETSENQGVAILTHPHIEYRKTALFSKVIFELIRNTIPASSFQ